MAISCLRFDTERHEHDVLVYVEDAWPSPNGAEQGQAVTVLCVENNSSNFDLPEPGLLGRVACWIRLG